MTQPRLAFWRRGARRAQALRTILHLEALEERNLLTNSLVVVPNPTVAGQNFSLAGVAAVAANDIWGVGSNVFIDPTTGAIDTQPLAEHFNGQSWSVVSTPLVASGGPIPPTAHFYGVAAAASTDVWAVGFRFGPDNPDNGETLIENWNGSSWSVVSSPTATVENTDLKAVAAISPSNVWAVGGNAGNVLVEHFDGTKWSVVNSPVFGSGQATAISADSANDIWVVDGGTFLHFNGTKWSSVASAFGPTSVTALSPTDVWATGTVVGGRTGGLHPRTFPKAAIEHWDGTSWSIVTSPNPNPGGASILQGIAAISANDIWAVGAFGGTSAVPSEFTLTEHWDGTSWSIIPSPSPAANQNQLFAVTALSDGTVAAVGHQQGTNGDQPLILQNAASAPQTATATAPLAASAATVGSTSGASPTTGSRIENQTQTLPALSDTAAVDQFFSAVGEVDQQLWLLSYNLGTRHTAANGDLDGLPGGM